MEADGVVRDPWVAESFETDNPYLRKLFAHEMFGEVPNGSGELLSGVSTHVPDEKLVSAIKVRHGMTEGGLLMVTTHWLRYVKQGRLVTVISNDEFWSFEYGLELSAPLGGRPVFRTVDGHQFQVFPTVPVVSRRQAKSFHEIYKLAALAGSHFQAERGEAAVEAAEAAAEAQVASAGQGIAAEIRELTELRDAGAITEAEFGTAKRRLLGS
jgi:hypothetical protein